jgi:hypothetical protein
MTKLGELERFPSASPKVRSELLAYNEDMAGDQPIEIASEHDSGALSALPKLGEPIAEAQA